MKHIRSFFVIALAFLIAFAPIFASTQTSFALVIPTTASGLMAELSDSIPKDRTAGSQGESDAATLLGDLMISLGVTAITHQEFSFGSSTSKNIVGTLPAVVQSPNVVIFGAHYDNVFSSVTNGYGDNLSGVCAMMQTIQKLKDKNLEFSVWFVLFGAEEAGGYGSEHFVSLLTKEEKEHIYLFLNFDSVGMGDNLYYSNGGAKTNYMEHIKRVNTDLGNAFELYTPLVSYPGRENISAGSLLFESDMSAFMKDKINSVSLYAGAKPLFFSGWKENVSQSQIAHIRDTEETNLAVFGTKFAENIEKSSDFASEIVLSTDFLSYSLPLQDFSVLFSVWQIKFISILCIALCFGLGYWYICKSTSK